MTCSRPHVGLRLLEDRAGARWRLGRLEMRRRPLPSPSLDGSVRAHLWAGLA